jgi:hypothetical protein
MKGKQITGVWIDDLDTHSPFNQRYDWCLKYFGTAQDYPPRWAPGESGRPLKFRFRDPKDELLFKIQWA